MRHSLHVNEVSCTVGVVRRASSQLILSTALSLISSVSHSEQAALLQQALISQIIRAKCWGGRSVREKSLRIHLDPKISNHAQNFVQVIFVIIHFSFHSLGAE